MGDELREFILTLQQSNISNSTPATDTTANVKGAKDDKYDAMKVQMDKMRTMMKTMMTQMSAKPNKQTVTNDTATGEKKKYPFKYERNMGGYCYSCGFHPVGPKHDSTTCNRKKEGHVATAPAATSATATTKGMAMAMAMGEGWRGRGLPRSVSLR